MQQAQYCQQPQYSFMTLLPLLRKCSNPPPAQRFFNLLYCANLCTDPFGECSSILQVQRSQEDCKGPVEAMYKCRTIQTKNVFLPSKCKSILKKGHWSSSFESSSENTEKTLVSRYSNKAIINWARI